MSPKPILYDFPFSGNSYKIRLLLSHLNIPYEYRAVDILKGESHTKTYLSKNPMGQVPMFELPDGTCLRESSAILIHLSRGTAFFPDDPLTQTRIIEWLCFEQSNIDQVIARARFRKTFPDVIDTKPEEFEAWYRQGNRALKVLNRRLKNNTFLVNDAFSIADISVFAYTHKANDGGFELKKYPDIQTWIERVQQIPGHITIDNLSHL